MSRKDDTIKAIIADNERRREADLREVLSTPSGRRVYVMLIEASGLYGAPPPGEPARSEWMGRRAFGLEIRKAFRAADPKGCFDAEVEVESARKDDEHRIRLADEEDLNPEPRS
jgi:hypothetical protein